MVYKMDTGLDSITSLDELLNAVIEVDRLQSAFLLVALGLSSLIFGGKVGPEDFTKCIKKPKALWLSMLAVVLLSPLLAYVLTLVLQLPVSDGIVLLVISGCPAGTLSPIFAYYTQSDVCLCLSVIVLSNLMSVGMIPLGMLLGSNAYRELDLTVIPILYILANLISSMGSIAVGMAFRKCKEKWADRFVKVSSFTPIVVIAVMIIIVSIKLPKSMHASAVEIAATLLYLVIMLAGSFALGLLSGLDHEVCRAMAFCSANKSVMLALTIVHASFTGDVLVNTLPLPTQFLIQYTLLGLVLSGIYRIYLHYKFSALTDMLKNLRA